MTKKRMQVLVVGGGNLERSPDGSWVTKSAIADYLHDLADRFGGCVWIAQASGTWLVELGQSTENIKGRLDPQKIQAIPIDGKISHAPRHCLILLRQLMRRPFAVFYLPAILTMTPMLPLAKLLTRRMAVYVGGDYVEASATTQGEAKWPGWSTLFRFSFEFAMWWADVVIARGRHLATLAKRYNRNVVETVPLGQIRLDRLPAVGDLEDDEPRRILYLGLLIASKGMDDLLRALRLLVDRRPEPEISLDVLGDGPERADFESLCQDLDLEARVRFHGWIEGEEGVSDFFARTHVLVMPSSTHPEGVPRSIDEALVRRIPVVATRVGGVPAEFQHDEVLLVDPRATDQLADGIEAILFDPQVRKLHIDAAEGRRLRWQSFRSAGDQHARLLVGEIPPSDF